MKKLKQKRDLKYTKDGCFKFQKKKLTINKSKQINSLKKKTKDGQKTKEKEHQQLVFFKIPTADAYNNF